MNLVDDILSCYKFYNVNIYVFKKILHNLCARIFNMCGYNIRRPKLDPEFSFVVGNAANNLLDNSAAKHKLSVKPKKTHTSNHQRSLSPMTGTSSATTTTQIARPPTLQKETGTNEMYVQKKTKINDNKIRKISYVFLRIR